MPIPQQWGEDPKPPPVSIGRKPRKKTLPPPDVPAGSGLNAPAPPSPRIQGVNAGFGQSAPAMPPEFTSDLPDPPVVGLNTGPAAQRRPVTIPPPAVAPEAVQTNTPGTLLQPDLGASGPAPPLPVPPQDPHAGESPTDRMVREAGERYTGAMSEQPKKRKGVGGRILSGLESFVIEGGRAFRNQMPRNEQELAYGLARGGAGAAYGAANTEYPSRVRIESKRALAGQEYDEALKRQSQETQNRLRDANADYATGRGPREDRKVELQSQYNRWRTANGDARLSETENYHHFLLEERRAGRLSQEDYRRSVLEDRDLDREQRTDIEAGRTERWAKKFDADERDRKIKNSLAERRAKAYEEAVRKSGSGGSSEVKKAQAAAEAEVYDDAVSEIEGDLFELEKTPAEERGSDYGRTRASLERQMRDARLKGEKARAVAGQPTKASVSHAELKSLPDETAVAAWAAEHGKKADAAVRLWKELRGGPK